MWEPDGNRSQCQRWWRSQWKDLQAHLCFPRRIQNLSSDVLPSVCRKDLWEISWHRPGCLLHTVLRPFPPVGLGCTELLCWYKTQKGFQQKWNSWTCLYTSFRILFFCNCPTKAGKWNDVKQKSININQEDQMWNFKYQFFETHLTNLWNFVEDNAEVFPLWKCIVSRIAAAWGYDTNSLEITGLNHSKWDETLILIICCFTWRHSSFSSVTKFITESSPFDLSPKLIIIFCQIKIGKNQAARSWPKLS